MIITPDKKAIKQDKEKEEETKEVKMRQHSACTVHNRNI